MEETNNVMPKTVSEAAEDLHAIREMMERSAKCRRDMSSMVTADAGKDLEAIRGMMERASKFRNINGLAIAFAGLSATAAMVWLYFYLIRHANLISYIIEVQVIIYTMLCVLAVVGMAIILTSWRMARANGEKLFNRLTRLTIWNLVLPLLVGAIISVVFLIRNHVNLMLFFSMIFYGLALFNVSKFTFHELNIFGLLEIAVGLGGILTEGLWSFRWAGTVSHSVIATCDALLWWTVGFGLLHIVFGFIIYFKYNKKR